MHVLFISSLESLLRGKIHLHICNTFSIHAKLIEITFSIHSHLILYFCAQHFHSSTPGFRYVIEIDTSFHNTVTFPIHEFVSVSF